LSEEPSSIRSISSGGRVCDKIEAMVSRMNLDPLYVGMITLTPALIGVDSTILV
jgi:hypothetical protein